MPIQFMGYPFIIKYHILNERINEPLQTPRDNYSTVSRIESILDNIGIVDNTVFHCLDATCTEFR